MLAWTANAQIALGVLGLAILMLTAVDMVGNMSISGAPDAVGRPVSLDWPKVISQLPLLFLNCLSSVFRCRLVGLCFVL